MQKGKTSKEKTLRRGSLKGEGRMEEQLHQSHKQPGIIPGGTRHATPLILGKMDKSNGTKISPKPFHLWERDPSPLLLDYSWWNTPQAEQTDFEGVTELTAWEPEKTTRQL